MRREIVHWNKTGKIIGTGIKTASFFAGGTGGKGTGKDFTKHTGVIQERVAGVGTQKKGKRSQTNLSL